MPGSGSTPILETVSDTALLVAHHRAMESARPHALFRDPYAERLAGNRGEEIARRLRWGKRMQKWWGKHMKAANARMQFAPHEGTKFFEPWGWREKEFHGLFENSLRIARPMPFAWIFKFQMKLFPKHTQKQMAKWRAGVVLLERV